MDKKISELTLSTPNDDDVIPFTDVGESVTYKALKSALKGDTGTAATATAGTTTTLAAGESATVTNVVTTSAAVFNFAIPQGIQGLTGADGACVESVAFVGNDMVFTLDNDSTVTLTNAKVTLKGDKGDTGAKITSAEFVGDDLVFTLDDDSTVTITGAKTALKGDKGDTGDIGIDWQGDWSAGTYTATQAVSHNGSSWIATTTTTEEPSISATDWDLMAQKGSDGAGSGDVVGPDGATGDNIAVYNSTTGKIIKDGGAKVADFVTKATYDAQTILHATSDNTPVALTVTEQTVVGRATGGNITALAIDSDLSSVSASDDTIPSAKATKAMGDLKLPLAGGTMTGDIQLGETLIKLDATLSEDAKWSGISTSGTLGATIAVGDLIYLNADDSRWELVDANLSDGYDKQLGISLTAGNDGDAANILLYGKVRSAVFPAFTVGSALYMSETAGDVTHTQPTTADVCIRIVGFALTAEDLMFNPSNDYIVHT